MNATDLHDSIRSIKLGKIINLKSSVKIPKFSSHKKNNIYDFNPFTKEDTIENIFHSYNNAIRKDSSKKRQMTYFVNKKSAFFGNENIEDDNFHKSRKSDYKNKKVKFLSLNENENNHDIKKSINKKGKNLKLYLHSEVNNRKTDLNLNSNNLNKNLENIENNSLKNLFYIKTTKNMNGNHISINHSINTLSIIPQITTESTNSISNQNIPIVGKNILKYNRLIKTRLNKTTYKPKLLQISQNNSEIKFEDKLKDKKTFNEIMNIRKKYPFILNPNPLMTKEFIDLPKNIKKTNKKYFDIVKNENDKLFSQYFCIIPREKFSKKFQNIGNPLDFKNIYKQNNKNKENIILNEVNEDKEENDNSIINKKIISGYKFLNEIKIKRNVILKIKVKLTKKNLFNKFKNALIFLSSKLSNISIFISEVIEKYQKPRHSYYFPNSHDLFFAIKSKNIKLVDKLLDAEKYLVLDFDYFKMTALHLAAKYNFYQIIPKLFEFGSHMNDKNYIGDTPLLISIKHKFMMSTIFLLLYMASPFTKDKEGFNALYYAKYDFKLNNILKKIISLHYISILGKTKNKIEFIQKEFSDYIINEYKNDLEVDAYNMISGRIEFFKRSNKNN